MTFVKKKRARVTSNGTFVGTRVKRHANRWRTTERLFEDKTQIPQLKSPNKFFFSP